MQYFVTVMILGAVLSAVIASDYVNYINMYIGTSYSNNISDVHDYGNAMLSIGSPFAHTPWVPQTRSTENKCESPYYYFDPFWRGMRRSHWMSGSCVIDYGTASVLPSTSLNVNNALNFHYLNHSNEVVLPHYYKVALPESLIQVEASSLNSAGIMKISSITNENSRSTYLLLMGSDTMYNESTVEILANDSAIVSSPVHRWYQARGEHAGFSGHHYFKFSRMAKRVGIIHGHSEHQSDGKGIGHSTVNGPAVAFFEFSLADGPVSVTSGCSFISPNKARDNMVEELKEFGRGDVNQGETKSNSPSSSTSVVRSIDLGKLSSVVKDQWNEKLGSLDVSHKPSSNNGAMFASEVTEIASSSKDGKHAEAKMGGSSSSGGEDGVVGTIGNDKLGPSHESLSSSEQGTETFRADMTVIFYSALWHTLLLPRIVSDYDGQYLSFGYDQAEVIERSVQSVHDPSQPFQFGRYFDDFSMWDTFR